MSNFKDVLAFHRAFGLTVGDYTNPKQSDNILRLKLMMEEMNEVAEAMGYKIVHDADEYVGYTKSHNDSYTIKENKSLVNISERNKMSNIAKELADLLYVVYGTAVSFGIDIDAVFKTVHNSNMSKLGEDGKPIYREDGKVLKGPNYKPANVDSDVWWTHDMYKKTHETV